MQSKAQSVRDIEGYMIDPEDWNPDLARQLAEEENPGLTEDYWPILTFMRAYWMDHRVECGLSKLNPEGRARLARRYSSSCDCPGSRDFFGSTREWATASTAQ